MNIRISTTNHILRIELDRPRKKNAITSAMYSTMAEILAAAEIDPEVRAIVIHGKSDVFTSGNDLDDFLNNPMLDQDAPAFRFLDTISHASKPLLAAVTGAAVGIGTTLLLHCDFVYAGESAALQLPFVALGLCPEAGSSYLLPRLAGHQRAAELLMLGEPVAAREAKAIGIVTDVRPDAEVIAYTLAQATRLTRLPPASLKITKALMKRKILPIVEHTMQIEHEYFAACVASPEAKEAFAAFFEKRKPDFSKFD